MGFIYHIEHDFIPHDSFSCDTTTTTFIWLDDAEQLMSLNITANSISLMGIVFFWWAIFWIGCIPNFQMFQNFIIFSFSNKLCSTFLSFIIYWICSRLRCYMVTTCTIVLGSNFVSTILLSSAMMKFTGSIFAVNFSSTLAVLFNAVHSGDGFATFLYTRLKKSIWWPIFRLSLMMSSLVNWKKLASVTACL